MGPFHWPVPSNAEGFPAADKGLLPDSFAPIPYFKQVGSKGTGPLLGPHGRGLHAISCRLKQAVYAQV